MMILWEKYSEDELRTIIKLYYIERGFNVDDLHEADRRGEKGADLIVYKKGENEKLAIALKVKPKKADIYQLQEIANRNEIKKKYIHTKTPSTDFYFEMEKYRDKVDFWDSRKLTYEISSFNPNLSANLIVSNHPLFACIGQINSSLASLLINWKNKEEFKGKNSPNSNFYRKLWRLKDDFSSLNKSLRLLQLIFESEPYETGSIPTDPWSLSILFEKSLDLSFTPTLEESNKHLLELISEYGNFISQVVEQTDGRSNWLSYFHFDWSLMPGKIRSDLLYEVNELNFNPDLRMSSIEKFSYEIKEMQYTGLFHEIGNIFRVLANSVKFIEDFVDDVFSYSINTTFEENNKNNDWIN